MKTEAKIQKEILDFLNSMPRTKAVKYPGGAFGEIGTPDIIACCSGWTCLFEVKRNAKEIPTDIQMKRMREWDATGAEVHVVSSVEMVRKLTVNW